MICLKTEQKITEITSLTSKVVIINYFQIWDHKDLKDTLRKINFYVLCTYLWGNVTSNDRMSQIAPCLYLATILTHHHLLQRINSIILIVDQTNSLSFPPHHTGKMPLQSPMPTSIRPNWRRIKVSWLIYVCNLQYFYLLSICFIRNLIIKSSMWLWTDWYLNRRFSNREL